MKNKIAIASAFIAATSFSTAEIVVNDFLSFEGFVDMSYTHTDTEFDSEDANESSYSIDQVEISWLFDFDPVTAQIDLQYEDADETPDNVVEQAFATYHFDNGGAITAGRYASMLGFEAFEPTGLYQYSVAYDMELLDTNILPQYAQGVKYTLEGDNTFFGISLQDEAFDNGADQLGGNEGESSYAVEVAGSYAMDNGLTFFLGGVFEDGEDSDSDAYALNAYATFETGAWIFAAEVNYGKDERGFGLSDEINGLDFDEQVDLVDDGLTAFEITEEEVFQALIMANFAYSEQASITGRISYTDHQSDVAFDVDGSGDLAAGTYKGEAEADFLKYTLAHGYAFTDNLFLVTELSYVDGEVDGDDFDAVEAAVELIFSF